jgi:hypothetical protein
VFRDKHLYWIIPATFVVASFILIDAQLLFSILTGKELDPYSYIAMRLTSHCRVAIPIAIASAALAWHLKRPRHALVILVLTCLLALAWGKGLNYVSIAPDG